MKNVNKYHILKFTFLLIKLKNKVFQNSMVLTKSRNWSQIPTQWWKLSGKNAPSVIFWDWHSNHSKSDEFTQKKSIIIHSDIWGQKLPFIIFVANRNLIFKNISIKMPFWAKTLIPYESRKKRKKSYLLYPASRKHFAYRK